MSDPIDRAPFYHDGMRELQDRFDGRKSGSVEGFSYSDANKNSGITWNKDQFLDYI